MQSVSRRVSLNKGSEYGLDVGRHQEQRTAAHPMSKCAGPDTRLHLSRVCPGQTFQLVRNTAANPNAGSQQWQNTAAAVSEDECAHTAEKNRCRGHAFKALRQAANVVIASWAVKLMVHPDVSPGITA